MTQSFENNSKKFRQFRLRSSLKIWIFFFCSVVGGITKKWMNVTITTMIDVDPYPLEFKAKTQEEVDKKTPVKVGATTLTHVPPAHSPVVVINQQEKGSHAVCDCAPLWFKPICQISRVSMELSAYVRLWMPISRWVERKVNEKEPNQCWDWKVRDFELNAQRRRKTSEIQK